VGKMEFLKSFEDFLKMSPNFYGIFIEDFCGFLRFFMDFLRMFSKIY
jgi:hypothetical protein